MFWVIIWLSNRIIWPYILETSISYSIPVFPSWEGKYSDETRVKVRLQSINREAQRSDACLSPVESIVVGFSRMGEKN